MPSSAVKVPPSASGTGASSGSNAPASCAAAAFSWLANANSSSWVREKRQRAAISSAPTPWLNGSGWSAREALDAPVTLRAGR